MSDLENGENSMCPSAESGIHQPWERVTVDKDFELRVLEDKRTARHVRWITKEIICEHCGLLLSTGHYTEVTTFRLKNYGRRKQIRYELSAGNFDLSQ